MHHKYPGCMFRLSKCIREYIKFEISSAVKTKADRIALITEKDVSLFERSSVKLEN